jgi:hypothetical protein
LSAGLDGWVARLAGDDPRDRIEAAHHLGRRGDPAAVPALLAALARAQERDEPDFVQEAIDALGRLGDARALAALLRVAASPQPGTMLAVQALGRLGCVEAAPTLVAHLANDRTRQRASTALGRLGNPGVERGSVASCKRFSGRVRPDLGGAELPFDGGAFEGERPPVAGMRVSFYRLEVRGETRAVRVRPD